MIPSYNDGDWVHSYDYNCLAVYTRHVHPETGRQLIVQTDGGTLYVSAEELRPATGSEVANELQLKHGDIVRVWKAASWWFRDATAFSLVGVDCMVRKDLGNGMVELSPDGIEFWEVDASCLHVVKRGS